MYNQKRREIEYMADKLLREQLAQLIDERGWQQKDFARLTGLSPSTVSRTLSGTMAISKEIAEIYARHLGLDREETIRRAFVECTCKEMQRKYQDCPSILKLIRVLEDFSTLPHIFEEDVEP